MAFTLPELVVVLAVIAVFAAIAVPRYGSAVHRYRADGAARAWVDRLTAWREIAAASGNTHTVTFNTALSRATLAVTRGGRTVRSEVVQASQGPFPHQILSADFNDTPVLVFDAYGAASESGKINIAVGGQSRTITVEAGALPRIAANLGGAP